MEASERKNMGEDQTPSIELKQVVKFFGDPQLPPRNAWRRFLRRIGGWFRRESHQEVLDGLDLKLPHHEGSKFVVLLGPSGCGKSTVLCLISGLQHPNSGVVLINGEESVGPNDIAATVPQAYTCFPWLTVRKNVEFGLAIRDPIGIRFWQWRRIRRERREKAEYYLAKVGLKERAYARPKQLSGGMQQRVAIARTLVLKPKIVLMDEPFGALDAQTRGEMQKMLLELWAEEQNLIVFVTHDINEAILLADDVIVFPPRPVCEIGMDRIFNVKAMLGHQLQRASSDSQFMELADKLRNLLKARNAVESVQPDQQKHDRQMTDAPAGRSASAAANFEE
jgi:ABC-type nitrate/sulfonate/bicarbonate transport system ATPase subunit